MFPFHRFSQQLLFSQFWSSYLNVSFLFSLFFNQLRLDIYFSYSYNQIMFCHFFNLLTCFVDFPLQQFPKIKA